MKTHVISLPRSGGTAVARMLGVSRHENHLGRKNWRSAVAAWSHLLRSPDTTIVFVIREPGEDAEKSLFFTVGRWVPSFGVCSGSTWNRWRGMRQSMLDFHEMNPSRTVLLRMEELGDFEALQEKLATVSLEVDPGVWEAVNSERPENLKSAIAELGADSRRDPFAGEEILPEKEDPFAGDDPELPIERKRQPKSGKPRAFLVSPEEHPRAIVYPWLSTAAQWDELRFSLRSVERHFEDKECPIFILGDAPPPWLKPAGRVQWRAIQGYAASREEGMWQAQVTGVQLATSVCWMNDDIYFLRDTGWDDLRVALTEGQLDDRAPEMIVSPNVWQRGLAQAVFDLQRKNPGDPVWRFATHTPFLFEASKSREVLRTYKLAYKGSWVTLYHNHHQTERRSIGSLKARSLPAKAGARYLNHRHGGPSAGTAAALLERFPDPAPWEYVTPRIIHQTWKDEEIPHDIYPAEWQDSWRRHHQDWGYRLWTDADLTALAQENYPEFVSLFQTARGVVKGDVGRLLVLHHCGGLYADLDYMALRPMDDLIQRGGATVNVLPGYTHNAILAGAAGHPLWLATARGALARWQQDPGARPEWVSGPELLEDVMRDHAVARWTGAEVCPLDWRNRGHVGEWQELAAGCRDSHAVTFWKHNW